MFAPWRWELLLRDWKVFAWGLGRTLEASGLALLLALALGIVIGSLSLAPWRPLRWFNRAYVEVIQNTPLLVQTFFFYYGLPYVGIDLPVLAVGVLALGIYTAAFIAEVIRASIQSIPRGQYEAAYSQGFTYAQAMRHVILPQAFRVALPPLTNQLINLVKNSQILALIPGYDLMYRADSWASATLAYQVAYPVVALLYLSITLPLATLARRLERRLAKAYGRQEEEVERVARVSGALSA